MTEHDSRILADEFKQIFIQFELARAKRLQKTLNKDLLKFNNQQVQKAWQRNFSL